MIEKTTKFIARFFGIIAGSLSGISGILIAIGYLAERSHLRMLGFTSIPVDLNQYLYTGANLLGILPSIIILQSISLVLEPLTLIIISTILLARFSMRFGNIKNLWDKFSIYCQNILAKFRYLILILFVFVQIKSLEWMVKAVLVDNLLFPVNSSLPQQEFTFLTANTDVLKQLILTGNEVLPRYFTQLLLMTLFIGLAIRYLMSLSKVKKAVMTFQMKFWLAINYLLLSTQVILLPCNYGVLLLNNKYQEVKVQFNVVEQGIALQEDYKELDLNNRPPRFVNAIRDQRLEIEGLPFKYNLEASPKIFIDPEGDMLTYSATSDKPNVVRSEIEKNFLTIRPIQKGKALITLDAKDDENNKGTTKFYVTVEDEITTWGAEPGDSISQKTLVVGEKPFVRDLMADPAVFKLLDTPPVRLTFQANSSSTDVASVKITGNKLEVQAISKGNAVISIIANDGFGRMVSTEFNLTVLEQNLQWPEDDRLLLIYQSNDVFYLYSRLEKRIWYVRSEDIRSMVYYGLSEAF